MNRKENFTKRLTHSAVALAAAVTLLSPSAFAAGEKMLVPAGFTVGIAVESEGVIVTGLSEVTPGCTPGGEAGIKPGDVITSINGQPIRSAQDVSAAVSGLTDKAVEIKTVRGGRELTFSLTPHVDGEGKSALGLWLRDGLSGIGTVTFYDEETGFFGALGHPVNDVDTGVLVPLRCGVVYRSSVSDVVKGVCGTPGQLVGVFESEKPLGTVGKNTESGIFGEFSELPEALSEPLPVAAENEIRTGPAVIRSNIAGSEVREYGVEITRVASGSRDTRCMMIKVTDPALLAETGGIVQGMSGSPIIQNGKLVGAVTHVLVNDPTRGYAVSAARMLAEASSLSAEYAA